MSEQNNTPDNNAQQGVLVLFAIFIGLTFLFIFMRPSPSTGRTAAVASATPTIIQMTPTQTPEQVQVGETEVSALPTRPTSTPLVLPAGALGPSPTPIQPTLSVDLEALPTRPTSTPLMLPEGAFGPTPTPITIPTEFHQQVLQGHLTATQIAINNAASPTLIPIDVEEGATPTPLQPATDIPGAQHEFSPQMVAQGENLFMASCMACHGMNGRGIPGLGKDLVEGEFSLTATNEELMEVIIQGRMPSDPQNTTGMIMPPMGGASLTEADVQSIVAYIRSLQQ